MTLLLFTPKYPPSEGGAARYFSLLVQYFMSEAEVEKIIVLTEWNSGTPMIDKQEELVILRVLPPRSQTPHDARFLSLVFVVLFQLMVPILIPVLVFNFKVDFIHAHSYFTRIGGRANNLVITGVLKLLRKYSKIVLDMRDNFSIPSSEYFFDVGICASQNIYNRVSQDGRKNQNHQVPVPIQLEEPQLNPSDYEIADKASPYLLFLGDINSSKGVLELLKAYDDVKTYDTDISLLFIGRNNIGSQFTKRVEKADGVEYLGTRPHEQALGFLEQAELLILPSKSEGMPRVCLEALSLGKKVLVPPGVPEFNEQIPEWVIPKIESMVIKRKIVEALSRKTVPDYNLDRHSLTQVGNRILNIYQKTGKT